MEKFLEAIRLYFCFAVIITMVAGVTGQGTEGGRMNIDCRISGTYTYPGWIKDGSVVIAIEGNPSLNGAYSSRFSYADNRKTLVVNPVNSSDAGSYVCSVTGLSPATTLVTVTLSTLAIILVICFGEGIAVCVFFVLTTVAYTVVIIICIYILFTKDKDKDKDNVIEKKLPSVQVRVILIIAIVIFLAVSAWFIAMMATVDAFQEMTQSKCNVYIGLLSFEVFDFVLGVCLIIYLLKDYPTEINPDPGKKRSVMKPKVKPQSGDLPPDERHGSDHSNVSRKDPIPPIRKNNSTTEFHMDNPGSERSAYRGLSTVSDQEYNKPRTNRLAPLDHKVDESIAGKKKKKTKMNTDVKLDNDNDKKKHIYY